jgi:hypothetical protein
MPMNRDPEYFNKRKVMFLPLDGTPVRMVDYPSQAEIDLRKLVSDDVYKAKMKESDEKNQDEGSLE